MGFWAAVLEKHVQSCDWIRARRALEADVTCESKWGEVGRAERGSFRTGLKAWQQSISGPAQGAHRRPMYRVSPAGTASLSVLNEMRCGQSVRTVKDMPYEYGLANETWLGGQ